MPHYPTMLYPSEDAGFTVHDVMIYQMRNTTLWA